VPLRSYTDVPPTNVSPETATAPPAPGSAACSVQLVPAPTKTYEKSREPTTSVPPSTSADRPKNSWLTAVLETSFATSLQAPAERCRT
jgi:hypothetical protein